MPESVPGGDPGGELLLALVQAFLFDRWERHKASKALDETLRRYFLDEDSQPRADRTQHNIDSFLVSVTPLITGHSDGPEECYVEIVDTTRTLTDPDRCSVYFYRLGSGRARKITRRI